MSLPVNHAEAKQLALIKQDESNLARCYLALELEVAERDRALSHYAAQYCEGWCEQSRCGVFADCGGCIARVTLQGLVDKGDVS